MKFILSMFVAVFLSLPTFSDSASLPSASDASISAHDPDNNSGGHTHVSAGRDGNLGGNNRRGLFQFDLSGIPAGSTIDSATLKLTVINTPFSGAVNSSFMIHKMTADWVEGTKNFANGQPASSGEVTWNNRAHPSTAWSGSAGANGDFVVSSSASTAVTGLGDYFWTDSALTADIQEWVDNPSTNFGWILISDNEINNKTARAFGSREHATAASRPELVVEYTPLALPTEITIEDLLINTNLALSLKWSGPTNLLYDVEYSSDLTESSGWKTAEAYIPAATSGSNVWNDVPLLASPLYNGNTSTFYRVLGMETNIAPLEVEFEIVASGLTAPGLLTHAGDGSGRLFIVEQTGTIRIITNSVVLPTPFLDISSLMTNLTARGGGGPGINPAYDERGLLGLAFHPNYELNGHFYIHYSAPATDGFSDNKTILAEYHTSFGNPNIANAASGVTLLEVNQPEFNHAGGTLVFGPDGFLYLALGDGGGAGDVHGANGNGQTTTNLLGTIIRIDIDTGFPYAIPVDNPFVGNPDFLPEIYAYGFRNPYRFSFDRGGSNALFCADVGQNLWEEIDIVEAGKNYGWRIVEGNHAFDLPLADTLSVDPGTFEYPIHDYKHGPLGISVIGGFVYRGSAYPELAGKYVFGDFSTGFGSPDGKLYYLSETRPGLWQRFEFNIQPGGGPLGRYVKGFGEDEDGEIYLLSDSILGPSGSGGDVRRLVKP